jgi:O-antigen/teichoic acid export membrane protein
MESNVLRWNFIFQYGWVITNIINSILLLPLYLKYIDTNTLGVWLASGSILGWMTLVDPGIGEVVQQRIAELRGREQVHEIGMTIGSGFIASGGILILSIALGFLSFYFLGAIIHKDISQYPHLSMALAFSILATGMSLVSFTLTGVNQGMHNTAPVAIASLTANVLFLCINISLLYAGLGVMSIALANLARALYINLFNITSLLSLLKKQRMKINFAWQHFKRFIRIFSFTSASKLISGLSHSIDMLVLARFIPLSMITIYEINKRPVNITSSLIGRHSVALMPLISHAKGKDDKAFIISLVYKQFRFYCYAALLAVFLFSFNHEDLINTWTGKGHYAGNTIIFLLLAVFFSGLISYFMAIVGYAVGDIKMNSMYNVCRGIVLGVAVYFAAMAYGIVGTLACSLFIILVGDVYFYGRRLLTLGFLKTAPLKTLAASCAVIIPLSLTVAFFLRSLLDSFLSPDDNFIRLVLSGSLFTLFYITLLFLVDGEIRAVIKQAFNRATLKKQVTLPKS